MRKLFSTFAAVLVAVAINAQTDFAAPGYSCAADDAVLGGSASTDNFYIDQASDPHQVVWSDVSLETNAVATWTIEASRGCWVSVALDLGPVIASNKHIFQVKILDDKGNVKGTLAEPAENADADQLKLLADSILIPAAGTYTVELRNNRDWGKGRIKNLILTYVADAPAELIPVDSIGLNKSAVEIEIEEVELLLATVLPDNAFDPSVTWSSSNDSIATVSETGLVTGLAAGTATITAKAGEKTAVCAVTVVPATIPTTDFSEPFVLSGKKAHLDGPIWKNDEYKLYGKGGSNKNCGTASWTVNVTKRCIVSGVLNGVEGGHLFALDLYNAEDSLIGTIAHADGKKWDAGEIALDSTLTLAELGNYTFKLRNTQEWTSGKVASVTLTLEEELPGPMVHQYEVAEAIAAGLSDGDEILVRGIITKMEFKGKNFAKYGSVNIYVKDATGAEGEFEFFNCYSLEADTFKASVPEYDATGESWAQFTAVTDAKGNTIHLKDTVIAFGKYKLFTNNKTGAITYELDQACYLVDIKHAEAAEPDTIALDFSEGSGWVSNEDYEEWGATDVVLYNIPVVGQQLSGDGDYLALDFYPEDPNDISGTYSFEDETLDADYTYLIRVNGTDTAEIAFVDGEVAFEVLAASEEQMAAQIAIAALLIGDDDNIYTVSGTFVLYYDFLIEEGIEDVALDPKKSIKAIRMGQLVIECNGKTFNAAGAVLK